MRKKYPSCEVCGDSNGLHVHHLISRCLYPNGALNVNNLIVLCTDCHKKFHNNGIWASEWLEKNKKEQFDWVNETNCLLNS